jgi:hypothetical protein
MKLALDMLNEIADDVYCDQKLEGVITTLRQALVDDVNTSQERVDETTKQEHEPVAWISDSPTKGNGKQLHWAKAEAWRWSSNITPLYTTPPKREWVGLTDEEILAEIPITTIRPATTFARAIEAKLKEKNT